MDRPRFFVLWIGLALSLGVALLIAGPTYREVLPANLPAEPKAVEAEVIGTLLAWIFCILIYTVSLCVAGASATLALRALNPAPSRWRLGLPGGVLVFAALVFVYDGFWRDEAAGVFEDFYAMLGTGLPRIEVLAAGARRAAALGSSVGLLVFAAMVGLTYRGGGLAAGERAGREAEAAVVRQRIGQLKEIVAWAGLGLAAGVVAAGMRLTLQIDFSVSAERVEVARSIVRSTTMAYGGLFTLWLLLGYVPATLVLKRWSERLSTDARPEASAEERKKWREAEGLEAPALSRVWQLLAAFAPLLTSALGEPLANALTGLIPV